MLIVRLVSHELESQLLGMMRPVRDEYMSAQSNAVLSAHVHAHLHDGERGRHPRVRQVRDEVADDDEIQGQMVITLKRSFS